MQAKLVKTVYPDPWLETLVVQSLPASGSGRYAVYVRRVSKRLTEVRIRHIMKAGRDAGGADNVS